MKATEISTVLRLLASYARQRAGRTLLALLSIVAASSIVVWVVSGYDALVGKFDDFAEEYLGRYALIAIPQHPADTLIVDPWGPLPLLDAEIAESLRQDPAVAAVDLVSQWNVEVTNPKVDLPPLQWNNIPLSGPAFDAFIRKATNRYPMLVGTQANEPPYPMVAGTWLSHEPLRREAVISLGSSEALRLKVGDEIQVTSPAPVAEHTFEIVGIIDQRSILPSGYIVGLPPDRAGPLNRGPASAALYIPLSRAREIVEKVPLSNYAGIALKQQADVAEFYQRWSTRLADAPLKLQSLRQVESELEGSTVAEYVQEQAWSATGIALLASLFIIFTTLSMGVDERVRQFAILRAVALTRQQIALLIFLEGLLLGLLGWVGGLLAGWGLLQVVKYSRADMLQGDSSLGWWCVILSGIGALGGAMAASILPAWKATRVRPLDVLSPAPRSEVRIPPWRLSLLGLVLIAINPLLIFSLPIPDEARLMTSAVFGYPSMAIGFICLAPLMIRLTEHWLGPLVAALLRLNPQLLAQQLSTNFWRTLGTSVALTLGLGLYISMQVWGYSMLGPFVPGDWVPDLIVALKPSGVPDEAFEAIRKIPGVRPDQCIPLAAQQTKFAEDYTGAREQISSSRQDNCVMLGVDPQIALAGNSPLFRFRYLSGTQAEVLQKFRQGRYCLVPDHFERESGLGVGDTFAVRVPHLPGKTVEYEIAGVVNMDGWHWMSKVGLRNQTGGRTAGLMFAPFEQVRKDFALERISCFWMNLDGTASVESIQARLQAIAEQYFDPKINVTAYHEGPFRSAHVRVATREAVSERVRGRASMVIWIISGLPLITLLITSLGIVNAVLASIRSRRWEMGVLRAIGITRLGLIRIIVAEALLIGLVACLLSLCFGTLAGYCGVGITRYVNVRGGQITHLVMPWAPIFLGFALTLSLCLIAALWPAIQTGRTEALKLLQQGRTAI